MEYIAPMAWGSTAERWLFAAVVNCDACAAVKRALLGRSPGVWSVGQADLNLHPDWLPEHPSALPLATATERAAAQLGIAAILNSRSDAIPAAQQALRSQPCEHWCETRMRLPAWASSARLTVAVAVTKAGLAALPHRRASGPACSVSGQGRNAALDLPLRRGSKRVYAAMVPSWPLASEGGGWGRARVCQSHRRSRGLSAAIIALAAISCVAEPPIVVIPWEQWLAEPAPSAPRKSAAPQPGCDDAGLFLNATLSAFVDECHALSRPGGGAAACPLSCERALGWLAQHEWSPCLAHLLLSDWTAPPLPEGFAAHVAALILEAFSRCQSPHSLTASSGSSGPSPWAQCSLDGLAEYEPRELAHFLTACAGISPDAPCPAPCARAHRAASMHPCYTAWLRRQHRQAQLSPDSAQAQQQSRALALARSAAQACTMVPNWTTEQQYVSHALPRAHPLTSVHAGLLAGSALCSDEQLTVFESITLPAFRRACASIVSAPPRAAFRREDAEQLMPCPPVCMQAAWHVVQDHYCLERALVRAGALGSATALSNAVSNALQACPFVPQHLPDGWPGALLTPPPTVQEGAPTWAAAGAGGLGLIVVSALVWLLLMLRAQRTRARVGR